MWTKPHPPLARCLCGAEPILRVGPDQALSGNEWVAWVECPHCKLQGATALHSEYRATESWNNRTAEILKELSDE